MNEHLLIFNPYLKNKETLDEAVNFGKGNKFWSFRPPPPKENTDLTITKNAVNSN